MMLMTRFGKFKLRLIATINMSILLSLFNIASTTSNYWLRYVVHGTAGLATHYYAGLWRSCPSQGGECVWNWGIVHSQMNFWSWIVRILVTLGCALNILVIFFYLLAFIYKLNKRSRWAICFMEWANGLLIVSFISIMIGFCAFITNGCSFSIWLHVISLVFIIITSNMITRTFATLYFHNTRGGAANGIAKTELPCDPEERIALAPISKDAITNTEQHGHQQQNGVTHIEMSKVNGSNEALIPSSAGNAPSIAAIDVNRTGTFVAMPQVNNA